MAKQRFRDLKKGQINQDKPVKKKSKNRGVTIPYATNMQKSKAVLTDMFMLLMPIMYIVFYLVMDGREGFAENKIIGWLYILIPFIILQSGFMFFSQGQTPGYRAYNIRLVDSSTFLKPPLFSIIFRNIAMVLSILTLFGWLMMFFRKDHKGLHDLLSNTTVIYEKHHKNLE